MVLSVDVTITNKPGLLWQPFGFVLKKEFRLLLLSSSTDLVLILRERSGLEVIFFSCSTQLSTKFILRINVKMFISMINTTSKRLKRETFYLSVF